jgi:hypothetical protein
MEHKFISRQAADGAVTITYLGNAASMAGNVNEFFISRNYKLKSGSPENGVYEYGNYNTMRILFGAFVKYFKVNTTIRQAGENVVVSVQKGHSGMSGGLIGMAKLNKELKRIGEAMEGLGENLGMYNAK